MAIKTYTYIATDQRGMRQTGVLQAASERQAVDQLSRRGYRVNSIHEGTVAPGDRGAFVKHVGAPLIGKVNYESQLVFFRQLASMHRSGVPLIQSLDTLARSARHPKLRYVINDMRRHVLEGKTISEAMERYPEVFSLLQVNLIRAGEQGGVLERSLHQVAEYLGREVKLRNQIKMATFYPKLLVVVSVLIALGANWAVDYFASMTGGPRFFIRNPLTNPVVLIPLAVVAVLLFLSLRILLQMPSVRRAWDHILLYAPYLGGTLRMLSMAKFGRAFSALYSGGVPIAKAIQLSADACGNEHLRWRMHPAAQRIQEGQGIAESFGQTGAFTPIALDMAYTGEQTGNMDAMFTNIAEQYEDEAEVRVEKSARSFTVAILLAVAAFIGYIVISFYLQYAGAVMDEGR